MIDPRFGRKESFLPNVRSDVQGLRGGPGRARTHADQIRYLTLSSYGCAQCVATGDTWAYLRTCAPDGQVGCCDPSKNKHVDVAGHLIARSREPGEDGLGCYLDDAFVRAEVS